MNKFRSLLVRHSVTLALAISCVLGTALMPASAYAADSIIVPVAAGVGGLAVGYAVGSGAFSSTASLASNGIANTSVLADQQCVTTCQTLAANAKKDNNPSEACPPTPGTAIVKCVSPSSGGVGSGYCVANGCLATSFTSLGGGTSAIGSTALGALAQAVGGLLGALLTAPSTPDDSGTGDTSNLSNSGCTSFYAESSSPTPSDPCAYYVAPASTINTTPTVGSCDALSSALGLCGASTTPIISPNPLNPINTPITTGGGTNPTSTSTSTGLNGDLTSTATVTGNFGGQPIATTTPAGLTGSIQTTGTGATFVTSDVEGNTETSSFFGGDTLGGFVNNLISNWCENRPWATSFIATIIPPSFFDGLCTANGFPVGPPATPAATATNASVNTAPVQQQAALTQTPVQHVPQVVQIIASSTPFIQPRVDIWAVPPSVPLGSRTTVFWNTENVTDCSETSPDGSFSQSSLSGGAATVPLTEPTTFSISCLDTQGNPATDYITVNISG